MALRTIIYILLILMTVACERVNIDGQKIYEKTFSGYNSETKVAYQKPEVLWRKGDAIYSFANNSKLLKSISIEEDKVVSATVPVNVTDNDTFVYSLHTQSPIAINDNCIVSINVDNAVQNGTFEEGYISIAGARIEETSLIYNCLTSFLEFEITDERIDFLIFHAAADATLSGKGIRITTSDTGFSVDDLAFISDQSNSIRVNINGPGLYYLWTLPVKMENGFIIDCYDSTGQLYGVVSSFNPLQLQQRTITNLGALEEHFNIPGSIDDVIKVEW